MNLICQPLTRIRTKLKTTIFRDITLCSPLIAGLTAIEQVAVMRSPEYHIQKDAAYAFVNGMTDGGIAIPPHGW